MKYDYGDDVIFKTLDQDGHPLEKPGAIVGVTPVENEEQSRNFGYPTGTVLYTVEFGDGSDALLPEESLVPDTDED